MGESKVVKQKSFLIDFLRAIASIGVVWLHVNDTVWNFSYEKSWLQSWFIETVFYWPVPIFFMITGITLMDYRKRYSTMEFLKKRFFRTVIPFIFWGIVSVFWSIYVPGYLPEDTKVTFWDMVDYVMNSKCMGVYWFFPAIFTVYLALPVLSAIPNELRKSVFAYGAVYGALSISVFPFLFGLKGIAYNGDLRAAVFGGYLLYVIIGYLLYNYEIEKRWRVLIYFLGILGWFMMFWFGWHRSYAAGYVDNTFGGYLNPPCLMMAVALFVFFKYLNVEKIADTIFGKIISKISKYSFAVYIIHFYIMKAIVDLLGVDMNLLSWKLYGVILVYAVAFLTAALLKKIPFVEKLLP